MLVVIDVVTNHDFINIIFYHFKLVRRLSKGEKKGVQGRLERKENWESLRVLFIAWLVSNNSTPNWIMPLLAGLDLGLKVLYEKKPFSGNLLRSFPASAGHGSSPE